MDIQHARSEARHDAHGCGLYKVTGTDVVALVVSLDRAQERCNAKETLGRLLGVLVALILKILATATAVEASPGVSWKGQIMFEDAFSSFRNARTRCQKFL